MGKKNKDDDKDDMQKHIEKSSKKFEKEIGHKRNEAYCPRCHVWYPSNSSAHSGH